MPVIHAKSKTVSIRDGLHFRKDYWYIMPESRPDKYFVEIPLSEHTVTFYTDLDSISFKTEYGKTYDFAIILNNKDSCFTRIIANYRRKPAAYSRCNTNRLATSDTIPFTMGDNSKIFIKGYINQSEPLIFQFDAGSMASLIKKGSVLKTNIRFDDSVQLTNSDGTHFVRTSKQNTLAIYGLVWKDISFHEVNNLSFREDGLIGLPLFQDKIVEIDYDERRIVIHETLPAIPPGFSKHPMILENNMVPFIQVTVLVDGKSYTDWFMFDTGHRGSIRITRDFVSKHGLRRQIRKTGSAGVWDATEVPGLIIGNTEMTNISAQLEPVMQPKALHGQLGIQLLKRFNTIIDNRQGYIYLKSNSLYGSPHVNQGEPEGPTAKKN
jgi:hypothetical protein